jgi:hypothetical protein
MASESARLSATAISSRLPIRVAFEAVALSNPTMRPIPVTMAAVPP